MSVVGCETSGFNEPTCEVYMECPKCGLPTGRSVTRDSLSSWKTYVHACDECDTILHMSIGIAANVWVEKPKP